MISPGSLGPWMEITSKKHQRSDPPDTLALSSNLGEAERDNGFLICFVISAYYAVIDFTKDPLIQKGFRGSFWSTEELWYAAHILIQPKEPSS